MFYADITHNMDTMYSTYSTYYRDTGPPLIAPTRQQSYLSHAYYVGIVLSELCTMDKLRYRLTISDILDRLDNLISYIHESNDVQDTVKDFFHNETKVIEILRIMEESGLLRITGNWIEISSSQLDYIRDFLLDYF